MSFSGKDRRNRVRVSLNGEVLGKINTSTAAPIIDLSENGALIEVQTVLRPGAIHTLRLPLVEDRDLVLRCRVVRSFIHGFDRQSGEEAAVRYRAAVEFVGLADEERDFLREHIRRRTTPNDDFDLELS